MKTDCLHVVVLLVGSWLAGMMLAATIDAAVASIKDRPSCPPCPVESNE